MFLGAAVGLGLWSPAAVTVAGEPGIELLLSQLLVLPRGGKLMSSSATYAYS